MGHRFLATILRITCELSHVNVRDNCHGPDILFTAGLLEERDDRDREAKKIIFTVNNVEQETKVTQYKTVSGHDNCHGGKWKIKWKYKAAITILA